MAVQKMITDAIHDVEQYCYHADRFIVEPKPLFETLPEFVDGIRDHVAFPRSNREVDLCYCAFENVQISNGSNI